MTCSPLDDVRSLENDGASAHAVSISDRGMTNGYVMNVATQFIVDALLDRQPVKIHQRRCHVIGRLQVVYETGGRM